MSPTAIALILFLGGSLATAWIVNSLGARLESKVQSLSHKWSQWPQRIIMYFGFGFFLLLGLNYYYINAYNKSIFELFENIPLLGEISQAIGWVSQKLSQEFAALFHFLPQEMPFLTILFVVFIAFLLLSLFNIKGVQRWLFLIAIVGFLYLTIGQPSSKKQVQGQQAPPIEKTKRPAWATD